MMKCLRECQKAVLRVFYNYGYFLARHPMWFLVIPVVVCGGLAIGFVKYDPVSELETLYTPMGSRAIRDREVMVATFPDQSAYNYNAFSQNRLLPEGITIFKTVGQRAILTSPVLKEIQDFTDAVFDVNVTVNGDTYTYSDICVKQQARCVVDGDFVFSPNLKTALNNGNLTYPVWLNPYPVDLSLNIGNVNIKNGTLVSAGSFKIVFPLRLDSSEIEKASLAWESEYIKFVTSFNFTLVEVAYSTSQSLNKEVDKGTKGDIVYFSLTFTFMITFASIVSSGGDCVSTRALLANAGVLAAGMGIMGAFGFCTAVGIRFVNIVGVMPFLALGIGVDDMFLLMGTWSETLGKTDLKVPERIGTVYKKAGVGITITSLTDFLAFAVGASSTFYSVRNFCIYTGMAVLLCYVCTATFFGACLTFHGRRVYSNNHTLTCKTVDKSRKEMMDEGRGCFYACLCGGAIPKKTSDDQSVFEKGPRAALTKVILWKPVRYLVLVVFAAYLAVAIWGCTRLRQGLELKDLVQTTSYFYKYQIWDKKDFGVKMPISFVTTTTKDYRDNRTLQNFQSLLNSTKQDRDVDPNTDSCWLTSLAQTSLYNTSSDSAFFIGLQTFLSMHPRYYNDIVFGSGNTSITASRCHIYSKEVTDSSAQADFMIRMRDLADASLADVFAYHPAFVYFEQYVTILASTLQTVGVTLAVMCLVTCIFLPHPLMVLLVMVQVVMIVTGIFGFMALWDLTLSSVTMIHLIMSVGFSVDFCAHVCTAYMVSEERSRHDRAVDAIIHASSAILNGGLSSLIGIVVLLASESYIFQSFFKIMLLVIGFGVCHAVFLIPVVLSFIGPKSFVHVDDDTVPSRGSHHHSSTDNNKVDVSDQTDDMVEEKSFPV